MREHESLSDAAYIEVTNKLLEQQNHLIKNQMESNRKRANWSLGISILALICSGLIVYFNWLKS